MIRTVSPFYQNIRTQREIYEQALREGRNMANFRLYFMRNVDPVYLEQVQRQHRVQQARADVYQQPTVHGEIAAIFMDDDGFPAPDLSVCYHLRNNRIHTLNIRNPNVDALCYPLIFPYGEAGKYIYI